VADPVSLMLEDMTARYAEMDASEAFTRLYADDAHFGHVFASLHERLNQHFDSINGRAKSAKHYWADSSWPSCTRPWPTSPQPPRPPIAGNGSGSPAPGSAI
jgi:hypothetical protein